MVASLFVPRETELETKSKGISKAPAIRMSKKKSNPRAQQTNYGNACNAESCHPYDQHMQYERYHHVPAQQDSNSLENDSLVAVGIPVAKGIPAVPLSDEDVQVALVHAIDADNFNFLRRMMMVGWLPKNSAEVSLYFSEDNSGAKMFRIDLVQASALHYAIVCGSIQCFAALLVAFPSFVDNACYFKEGSSATGDFQQVTTFEMASFMVHFTRHDPIKNEKAKKIAAILDCIQRLPWTQPLLAHDTTYERLVAAGEDGNELVNSLYSAALPWQNEEALFASIQLDVFE
ncbi:hypothetical protein GUITHDRAFT_137987 [Guillardia theta CCMP2712]|uniref:Uncharacterized protein n=1 Tax=Guillardia theta (strain CCMP2712) TaxID=905079 RepID=L1JDH5_GUITC|nr:hypothetical protein GUITHDRAFT_137987 [Guillardia theta CCMP2712]EKX46593.1 hypothetical protein GUITHDRAFT_137987 [Guillardia theta CCMP2712]|eukprot:XP_005833573.1 hypothetical protein GUITHDRAFT_137987 [Guillardia theta CCMP2712]